MQRQLQALWSAIDRAIDRSHFPPRPGRLCDWCSFRSMCPAWESKNDEEETLELLVG